MHVIAHCVFVLLLIIGSYFCIAAHEHDGASMGPESGLSYFGHVQAVFFEDLLAAGLLALVAVLVLSDRSGFESEDLSLSQKLRKACASILVFLVFLLMGLEFLGQMGVVITEDQTKLSMRGRFTEVVALLLTALAAGWSWILAARLWPAAELKIETEDTSSR